MDRPTSLSTQPDLLRAQVIDTVRKHWVSPRIAGPAPPVPASRVEDTARAVLDGMLTRPFRVGPLPPPDVYDQLLQRVRLMVRRGQPVRVTLGYGPLKNQNAVAYSRADWAEFFALCHLVAWHNKVQAVYPPGLRIRIIFDDSTLVMANRADRGLMKSYMTSVRELIDTLTFGPIFYRPMRQALFAWIFHLGFYQVARWRVRRWEQDPTHQAQLQQMHEFARRNVTLPPGLSTQAREQYLRQASHRYRVYWEALQLSGLTRRKNRVVAMYLDGSQHHIRQTVALHLTTLDKGNVTQPWQGAGALLDNGHGKLEPFVLTAGRLQRYTVQTVDGLDLVPCPGFERLAVVQAVGVRGQQLLTPDP